MVREQNIKEGCAEREETKKVDTRKRWCEREKGKKGKGGGEVCILGPSEQGTRDSGFGKLCSKIQIQVLLGICHKCLTLNKRLN